ncbi:MAG: zinc-binding protein, partial [Clostridiales bacterium]|nr:zinc-binding protein [Clostridiales bacterium]
RGTLKYNTFIATLQFVNEICNVAVSLSDEEMEALTWEQFISRLTKEDHSELITYLKERNLYTKGVN